MGCDLCKFYLTSISLSPLPLRINMHSDGKRNDKVIRTVKLIPSFYQILLWSQIEMHLAIISASAPALRPLFNKTFSSSYNRSGYQYNNQQSGRSNPNPSHNLSVGGTGTGAGGSGTNSKTGSSSNGKQRRSHQPIELYSLGGGVSASANGSDKNESEEYILDGPRLHTPANPKTDGAFSERSVSVSGARVDEDVEKYPRAV